MTSCRYRKKKQRGFDEFTNFNNANGQIVKCLFCNGKMILNDLPEFFLEIVHQLDILK